MNALRRLRFSLRNQGMGSTLAKARGLVLDEEAKLLREKVDVRFAANPSARVSGFSSLFVLVQTKPFL